MAKVQWIILITKFGRVKKFKKKTFVSKIDGVDFDEECELFAKYRPLKHQAVLFEKPKAASRVFEEEKTPEVLDQVACISCEYEILTTDAFYSFCGGSQIKVDVEELEDELNTNTEVVTNDEIVPEEQVPEISETNDFRANTVQEEEVISTASVPQVSTEALQVDDSSVDELLVNFTEEIKKYYLIIQLKSRSRLIKK